MLSASATGISQQVKRYDVIITEIMADPSPPVGLPNAEYLEIKNVSPSAVNLFGWKLSDATSTATITSQFVLQPDSAVVLCANSNVAALSAFGKTIGVPSFPSLDNDGDLIALKTPGHLVVHAVEYDPGWYLVESKKQGGWSLEMIDVSNPCTGAGNWKASMHAMGGTPGKPNSVSSGNPDTRAPALLRTYSPDSLSIILVFDETIDSIAARNPAAYQADGLQVVSATALPPLFTHVLLKLAAPLQREKVYVVTANAIKDCKGNSAAANKVNAGLPSNVMETDIVINEILFDPLSGAYDFVEIYNRSKKIIDLSSLHIANRDINGAVASVKKLTGKPFYLYPDEYKVVTEDRLNLTKFYLAKRMEDIIEISQLPSYPDNEGKVLMLDLHGNIIDEVHYLNDWHFALIANREGISLERMDPDASSTKKDNWHSAASTAGYGTPGYQNSQFRSQENIDVTVALSPRVFSPDNDGTDDVLTINYFLEEEGFVANVTIFDRAGRQVKFLVKTDLLAFKGNWTWDGLDEKKQKLMIGTYIVLIEIYNLKGKRKIFKETVVLARRNG